MGASIDGEEEANGEEEEGSTKEGAKKPNTYRVYGTVKNPTNDEGVEFKKEDYITEIINVLII